MGYVQIGIAAVGLLSSLWGSVSGKEAAEKAAEVEAKAEGVVTAAKLYDLRKEERTLAGETRAIAAGSGVKADIGSPLTILAEQAKTFARERMVTAQVGATKAAASRRRGSMVGQQVMYQGFGQGIQYAGTMASLIANQRTG